MAYSSSVAAGEGARGNPRRLIPALSAFYDWIEPYTYPLTRFIIGATLVPIGLGKIQGGMGPVMAAMSHFGLEPVGVSALCVIAIESIGGLCIAIGLFTRFWAAAMAIEMAVITFLALWPQGYARAEQSLIWGALAFVVALKGGGRFSMDRLIGWEL